MPERTSRNGGVDWIHEKVVNDEPTTLTKKKAREQLLYDLRDQLGTIRFEVNRYEQSRHDGTICAYIGGKEVDHYGFSNDE